MSSPQSGCEARGADVAPYVLGALPEEEHELFREHLSVCAACREEVAALEPVVAALPAAVPARAAPPDLRGRVLATVRSEAQLRNAGGADEPDVARHRRRQRGPGRRPLLAAVAAVAAVAVLAAVLVSGGGSSTRVVGATVAAPGARASLRLQSGHALLRVAGMPQSPRGRVYQVWIKRSGSPVPTDALFTVSHAGDATVAVPGPIGGVKAVMVTAEPLGGSRAPTSTPVIVANLG